MPKDLRVGDTVNYVLANGQSTTAEVTAITSQDDVAIVYYAPQRIEDASAARSAAIPRVAGTFYKEA